METIVKTSLADCPDFDLTDFNDFDKLCRDLLMASLSEPHIENFIFLNKFTYVKTTNSVLDKVWDHVLNSTPDEAQDVDIHCVNSFNKREQTGLITDVTFKTTQTGPAHDRRFNTVVMFKDIYHKSHMYYRSSNFTTKTQSKLFIITYAERCLDDHVLSIPWTGPPKNHYYHEADHSKAFQYVLTRIASKDIPLFLNNINLCADIETCIFKNEEEMFNRYCMRLYKYSDAETLLEVLKQFFCFPAGEEVTALKLKMFRRHNSKFLALLITDLGEFINHRPSDNYRYQLGITQSINSFINGLGKTETIMDNFNSILNRAENFVAKGESTLETVNNTVESLTTKINSESEHSFASIIKRAKKNSPIILAHFLKLFSVESYKDWLLSLSTIFSIIGINEIVFDKIASMMTRYQETYSLQSNTNPASIKLLALVSTYLGEYSPTKLLGASAFSSVREMKAVVELMDLVSDIAKEWGIIDSPENELVKTIQEDVVRLLSDYVKFQQLQIEQPSRFLFSTTFDQFKKSFDEVRAIEDKLIKTPIPSVRSTTLVAEVAKLRDNFMKLFEIVTSIRRGTSIRQEPVAICMLGAPGIGKTQLTLNMTSSSPGSPSKLAQKFVELGFDKNENWVDNDVRAWNIWNESASNGSMFADGYVGQDIHIVDDIFQDASHMDHTKWVNYVSPAKFLTNQAALEAKGLPYTAKLVVASANKFPHASKTIVEVQALQRRFVVVHVIKNQEPPQTFDPSFPHLTFRVYNTGIDYVNNLQYRDMNYDQLCELILHKVQEKYKTFCLSSGTNYEEQARGNVHMQRVGLGEFSDLSEDAKCINTEDWISKPPGAFHRIIFDTTHPSFRIHFPQAPNGRLIEMIKHYPELRNTANLFKYFEMWSEHSYQALIRLDECCYLSDAVDYSYYFKVKYVYVTVNGLRKREVESITVYFTCVHQPDDGPDDEEFFDSSQYSNYPDYGDESDSGHNSSSSESGDSSSSSSEKSYSSSSSSESSHSAEEDSSDNDESSESDSQPPPPPADEDIESWFDWVYSKIPKVFKENSVITYISSIITSSFSYLKNAAKTACDYMLGIINKLPKVSVIQSIISFLNPISCFHPMINIAANTAVTYIMGCIIASQYQRINRIAMESALCSSCGTSDYKKHAEFFKSLHESYCKEHCSIGRFYSTHTQECSSFELRCRDILVAACGCNRSCNSYCRHGLPRNDKRHINFILNIVRDYYPEELDSYCLLLKDENIKVFNKEDSSNSLRAAKKTKFNLEEHHRTLLAEDSSNSLRAAKKTKFSLESRSDDEIRYATYGEEMLRDPGSAVVMESMKKLIVKIRGMSKKRDGTSFSLNGWGYQQYIIGPAHLLDSTFEVYAPDGQGNIHLVKLKTRHNSQDIAVWELPENASKFPDFVMRHLITKEDVEQRFVKSTGVLMCVPVRSKDDSPTYNILPLQGTHFKTRNISIHYKDTEVENVISVRGLKYLGPQTQSGDCGSPLFAINNSLTRKLLGFHILGGLSDGYSTCVTKEILEELINKSSYTPELSPPTFDESLLETNASLPVVDYMNLVTSHSDRPSLKECDQIQYVGNYRELAVPAQASNLLEHRFKDTFEVTAIPAPLHEADVEDPSKLHANNFGDPEMLQTQLDKYSHDETHVENIDIFLETMVDQLSDHFTSVLKDEDLTPMSESEALSGIVEDPDSNALNMLTTAGEPFQRIGKTPGKKKNSFCAITQHKQSGRKIYSFDKSTTHGKYLTDVIDKKEELAFKKIRTLSLWKNCLKDETRPLAKAKIGKTRLFTAAPFDTVFLGRKYFGKFKEAWQRNRNSLFHSVGIDAMSPDWTILAESLLEKGSQFYDADFSAYDGRLRSDFMRAAGQIVINSINRVTQKSDFSDIMFTLWEEYVETFQVGYRSVALVRHGNPSGNPMTTVVNCIVNLLYHWYAYMRITNKFSLSAFAEEIGFTCFGDDVLYCAPVGSLYTFNKVATHMAALGQEYTTAAKDVGSSDSRTIGDVTFLKRKFRQVGPQRYVAPLDSDSIEQQFNYTYIGENDYLTIKDQLKEASIEAALHGPAYYKYFSGKMNSTISNDSDMRKHMTGLPVYADAQTDAFSRTFGSAPSRN